MLRHDAGPLDPHDLERAIGTLRHRGPDHAAAALVAPGVGMAHARLSVIDLSDAANQPMVLESGPIAVAFNGEIYNFREIRETLARAGHQFRTHSDTEVILALYHARGEAGLDALEGMFAFVLWDATERKLILARDRTGKKPLYLYDDGVTVIVASQPKAIFATHRAEPQLDDRALAFFLSYGYVPGAASFYRRVQKVEAGTRRVLRRGRWTTHCYWDLPTRPPDSISIEEAKREVRQKVTAAVERRLVADVPIGAFLSGGIDSTLVTGLMARAVPGRVKTFSIGFEGPPQFDETPYARLVARKFATDHTEFVVRPCHFELIRELATYFDEPFGDSSALPSFLLCRLAREHVTVALTGDGGDESFGGYARLVAARDVRALPEVARRGLARMSGLVAGWANRLPAASRVARRLGRGSWTQVEYFCELNRLLPAARVAALLDCDAATIARETAVPFAAAARASAPIGDLVNRLLYVNTRLYLVEDLNVKMDRASMAHGLETRSPFLDREVMELAARLPGELKLHRGARLPGRTQRTISKWILKEAFPDLLPEEIRDRPKSGFCVPLASWFREDLHEPTRQLLTGGLAGHHLGPRRVLEALAAHERGEDRSNEIWLLVQLELWLQAQRQRDTTASVCRLTPA